MPKIAREGGKKRVLKRGSVKEKERERRNVG